MHVPSRPIVAVVVPCYKVTHHILAVLAGIGRTVDLIYVIDDDCPERSGDHVQENCADCRVRVLYNRINLGVGGAVAAGYRQALADGADVIVKLDGDGQMDPRAIAQFIRPIIDGRADYTKGNRFYNIEDVRAMPGIRLAGNAALSFATKLSTGYWTIFDPTNGYTAISAAALRRLPLDKIAQRYFFESDMLFRLGTIRAKVVDIPMQANYGTERSNLAISRIVPEFILRHAANFGKRLFYNYLLRDFSLATLELISGALLFLFGMVFGAVHWRLSIISGVTASTGTVMIAAVSMILGFQLILSFFSFDIQAVPASAIHPLLEQVTFEKPVRQDVLF